ncbi:ATP-binding protein [Vibrio ziniensis]|uniref:histidine kinase n=1 Tax=Vibrio ziniensis TaxID=2711221 RepID=A0A6G7CQK0_9VIBR|nr:ATP-binding protein [Vibrio ziniensis]QIH44359.1 transporter substrate-binding domain-containing protein [Vibrio ziniensis]
MSRLFLLFIAAISLFVNTYALSAPSDRTNTMPTKIKVALLSRTLDNHVYHDPTYDIETDYVDSLAKKLNVEVEYDVYPTISSLHKAIDNNDVDLAVGVSDNSDSNYIYSSSLYKSSIAIWYRNKNLMHVSPNSMKWVCVKDSIYCKKLVLRGLPNIYEAQSFADAINQVNSGLADAVLDNYVSLLACVNSSTQTVGRIEIPDWFGTENIRIVAQKNSQLLLQNINLILNQEAKISGIHSDNLYHKIDEARAAAANAGNPEIRYTVWDDSYPLFYRDTSGEVAGFLPDLLKLIETRTSIRFQYIPLKDGETPLGQLEKKSIDFVPAVLMDSHDLDWTAVSNPLASVKYFAVSYKGIAYNRNAKEGVLFDDTGPYQSIKNRLFGESSITYMSIKQLIEDLKNGKLRQAYVREDILDYLVANDDDDKLQIKRHSYKEIDVAITVREDDRHISDLIDGVASTINPKEVHRLQNGYTQFNIVYGYDKSFVMVGLSILAGIIILLVFIFYLWKKNFQLKVSLNEKEAQRTQNDLRFLQNIINGLPNQIFIHDANHKLLLSNCCGVESGKCKSCTLAQKVRPDHMVIENGEELSRVLDLGETIQRDVDVQTCSAGLQTIDYFRTRISGPSSADEFVLTVVNDVSEQKEQERALRAANETAQQAVQARERFLASMSHELRTPIAGMAGLLEMLKIRTDDEDTLMMINNIITSTRHLHLLVNDILDFSKLEAQQLELDLGECHLLREAGELLRVHCASAQKKELQFEVNWQPTPVKVVKIDALRFSQIINNLLSNAIKFTDVGKITVDIALDEKQVYVSVTDTGVGMSKDVIKGVFNPFFQADSTIARRFGGTGLGLAIVHNLITVMGGKISIDSEPNLGTTVSFTIPHELVRTYESSHKVVCATYHGTDPLIKSWINFWTSNSNNSCSLTNIDIYDEGNFDDSTCAYQHNIVIKKDLDVFRSRNGRCVYVNSTPFFPDLLFDAVVGNEKMTVSDEEDMRAALNGKVLVAEDNPINQLVFKQQLAELGVEMDIVDNGLIALELLQAKPMEYDLLITDCHMPVMDGYELVNRVRMQPELSHITLIGCTAEDSRVANEKALDSGFDSMLYKPYGINRMYKLLAQYLSSAEPESEMWLEKYDAADAQILSQVYVDTMEKDLALLIDSKDDRKAVKEIAHRIKGGAGTVGETNVHQRALDLENGMQNLDGNIEHLFEKLIADISISIDQTKAWIETNAA